MPWPPPGRCRGSNLRWPPPYPRAGRSLDDELPAPALEHDLQHAVDRCLAHQLDATAASQAVDDLRDWPGERYGHRALLARAWELRESVRSWDALYVALAEALGATLLTTDIRLSGAVGPACPIDVA